MDRRQAMFYGLSALAALATGVGATGLTAKSTGGSDAADGSALPFSYETLLELAAKAATVPYVERRADLPQAFRDLSAEDYAAIMFRSDASSWKANGSQFSLNVHPCGFLYETPVDINIVENGHSAPLMVDGPAFLAPQDTGSAATGQVALPYSGLSLNQRVLNSNVQQPIVTFQGASYFKALAPGQRFGTTARGLAIKTAHPDGEEIPVFRRFWVALPQVGSDRVMVYALLDSPSASGAYLFTMQPGVPSIVDVEATLFPRRDIPFAGIAPLSSMFLFDEKNHRDFDDYRPAVHNADGLSILNGMNEWIWRPLSNPGRLQISAFADNNPRGFGLIQRKDRFEDFADETARFENRPSCWIEPLGDWGKGQVQLIEIPSKHERHDNIAVFWRPAEMPKKGQSFHLAYRMHWGRDSIRPAHFAKVISSRTGRGSSANTRRYSVMFESPKPFVEPVRADTWASRGSLSHVRGGIHPTNPNLYRVSMELDPAGEILSELRIALRSGQRSISEVWLHRWIS